MSLTHPETGQGQQDRQGMTLSSPAPSHQLFQGLPEPRAGTQPRPALHLLNFLQALVLCGLQEKSVLRVPGPYPTHSYPWLCFSSPFRPHSIHCSTHPFPSSHSFVPLTLPRNFEPCPPISWPCPNGYELYPVSVYCGVPSNAESLAR